MLSGGEGGRRGGGSALAGRTRGVTGNGLILRDRQDGPQVDLPGWLE